jgi:hypothetical protein
MQVSSFIPSRVIIPACIHQPLDQNALVRREMVCMDVHQLAILLSYILVVHPVPLSCSRYFSLQFWAGMHCNLFLHAKAVLLLAFLSPSLLAISRLHPTKVERGITMQVLVYGVFH